LHLSADKDVLVAIMLTALQVAQKLKEEQESQHCIDNKGS
jgi:hypothetical protein